MTKRDSEEVRQRAERAELSFVRRVIRIVGVVIMSIGILGFAAMFGREVYHVAFKGEKDIHIVWTNIIGALSVAGLGMLLFYYADPREAYNFATDQIVKVRGVFGRRAYEQEVAVTTKPGRPPEVSVTVGAVASVDEPESEPADPARQQMDEDPRYRDRPAGLL